MIAIVALLALTFTTLAQVAQTPSEPTSVAGALLSVDLLMLPTNDGAGASDVLITLANRSSAPLTNISVRAGPGPLAASPRHLDDLAPGQSRAEQVPVQQGATTSFAVVSYEWQGRTDSAARTASLAVPPVNPLLVPILTGIVGISGALLGAVFTNWLSLRRDAESERRDWYKANAPRYREFLNQWNRSPDIAALEREYAQLRANADVLPRIHRAYLVALTAYQNNPNSADARRTAADAFAGEIQQMLSRLGPPLDA